MTSTTPTGTGLRIHEDSDHMIIGNVLGGDVERFEVLMRRYNERLFRVTRAILRNDADAEDAVQHAYLAAYAALGTFRGEASFATWLTKIAVHEACRRLKDRGRLGPLSVVSDRDNTPSPPTPEEQLERREMRRILERAVDELPEPYRIVFVLREVQELSTNEVAEALGLSEEAVRVRLHRARRSLKDWLELVVDAQAGDVFSFAGDRCDRIVKAVLSRLLGAAHA